ncbi:hypothetical protein E2C01_031080 [Portunus trituberculatus]|uniref:Uncharacterized protein n=1 Tax=Portunus trituberculatus TaxID=210409 RepID=A0A5B7EXM0_PORTR|nr:hypothetical protein [Portunus trituberculatus]
MALGQGPLRDNRHRYLYRDTGRGSGVLSQSNKGLDKQVPHRKWHQAVITVGLRVPGQQISLCKICDRYVTALIQPVFGDRGYGCMSSHGERKW